MNKINVFLKLSLNLKTIRETREKNRNANKTKSEVRRNGKEIEVDQC